MMNFGKRFKKRFILVCGVSLDFLSFKNNLFWVFLILKIIHLLNFFFIFVELKLLQSDFKLFLKVANFFL
jgi:hypothetical protein